VATKQEPDVGLREDKKRRQRQAIIDAAVELFRERGFEATRVQDLVARLQISEPTFFNYFATKQAVLDAAIEDYLERMLAGLADHDEKLSALDRLERLIGDTTVILSGDPEFARLFALNFQLGLARGIQRQAFSLLTGLLEAGQRGGEVRSDLGAAALAEAFVSLVLVTISNCLLAAEEGSGDPPTTGRLDVRLSETWAILRAGMSGSGGAKARDLRLSQSRRR